MTNPIKIAFHKPTDKFVHIDSVSPTDIELRRNCYCLKCDEKLQAVLEFQDKDRIKFFRHDANPNCEGSQETALHELAKQILLDNLYVTTKEYGKISFTDAVAEKRLEQKRPDITATYDGKKLYIEVYVSHAVDIGKEKFFVDKKYRSLEINLSECTTSDIDEIKRLVLDELSNKKVFYWLDETQIVEQVTNKDWTTQISNFISKYWKEILGAVGFLLVLRYAFKRKK